MFPLRQAVSQLCLYEGSSSMKTEKYLLLVLVVFFLIVLGTYLHKIVH